MATAMHQARVPIAATGTAVALGSSQEVDWVRVRAWVGNQGLIFVGSSTVTGAGSTVATTDGYFLQPGDDALFLSCDLDEIFIEGKAGDSVYYVAGSGYVLPIA